MASSLAQVVVDGIVRRALEEDLLGGDITSESTVPPEARAQARLLAKQDLVFCGAAFAQRAFALVDPEVEVEVLVAEGERVGKGTDVMRVGGSARSLLAGERTALNLLQRACGIATLTAQYVAAAGPNLRVADTRKTMPGLRALDRYAVRRGGGFNHRNDLGSAVLIKENHVRAAGSVRKAIEQARRFAPHTMRIECEVTTLSEFEVALDAGADVIMLDNFDNESIAKAVSENDRGAVLEVSGGITIERLPSLSNLGAHVVSVGALTHSVEAADISMLFEVENPTRPSGHGAGKVG